MMGWKNCKNSALYEEELCTSLGSFVTASALHHLVLALQGFNITSCLTLHPHSLDYSWAFTYKIFQSFVFIIIYDIILVNSIRSEYFLIPIHLILNPWLSIWKASHIEKGKGVNSKPSIYFNVLYNMDHCVYIRTTFIC